MPLYHFAKPASRAPAAALGRSWLTPEGIPVKPVYGADDLAGIDFLDTYPGIAPYLRGPYPTMYVTQPWTVRQYAGFSTAEDSNAFYRRNLAAGQKGLSVAFDLATHRGYDSDHPRVAGDVGMAGVAIDSIYDMRTLFSGIPLDQMSVSMTMNGAVLPVLALYIVAAEEQGVPPEKLSGTIQNDILKEFMVRNTYIYPPGPSMRIISDIFAYTSAHMPKFNSISISGYHMQEAGATQDLELAYTLADGVEYVRAGIKAGLDVDRFAPRLSFFWAIGMNFFMEVAKMRAARAIWAKLMKPFDPEDRTLAVAAHPLPDVGLVAHRAGRVQQRGAHLHRSDGGDAGPHPVAAHQRARRGAGAADGLFRAHRPQHATVPAAGERHHPHRRSVGRLVLCGAPDPGAGQQSLGTYSGGRGARRHGQGDRSRHPEAAHRGSRRAHPGAHRCRPAIGDRGQQVQAGATTGRSTCSRSTIRRCASSSSTSLTRLKRERDPKAVEEALAALTRAADGGNGNLLALAIDAARAKATVGEISLALEKVYGRHRAEIRAISGVYKREVGQMSAAVERVQKLVSEFEENEGRRPRILVAKIGQDGHDRGQKVIASAFADLGFDVDIGPLFATPAEAARQAVENDVHIVGISSFAAGHLTWCRQLKAALAKEGRDDIMIVVGGVVPPQDYDALTKAGAEAIFPPGTVIAEAAEELIAKLNAAWGMASRRPSSASTSATRSTTSTQRHQCPVSEVRDTQHPPTRTSETKGHWQVFDSA